VEGVISSPTEGELFAAAMAKAEAREIAPTQHQFFSPMIADLSEAMSLFA
jgi:hypothetical protein